MKFKLLFLFIFLLCEKNIFCQYDDAQLWQNIYVERNITQKLLFRVNEEGRITENVTRPSYIYADMGFEYKQSKHFHIQAAYVPIAKRQVNNYISWRHQFYIAFTLKKKIGRFVFYDRQMFQDQYNDINRTSDWNIPSYYLRNKVTIKYNIKKKPFIPYVAEEYYFQYSNTQLNGKESDRMRFYLGCFYEKDLLNEFELYYLIEPHYNVTPAFTNWIIGVGYARKLYW